MNQMADPSHGVAQQLQNHLHLISAHRYPLSPTLNIDQAFRALSDAPTVVKQLAAMAWQYVSAPPDGTLWLEWISPRSGDYRFASDGYVWGDQEASRREEFGGYTMEICMQTIGYRPQYDQMATHARTRYHLVAKHPNANAPPPDPNLWLVHYHQTDQSRFMPYTSVPVHPQMRQQMGERRWLEAQGRIERKEFMLHDREHWPHVTLPGHMPPQQQQGGMPGMNPMMAQQHAQQQQHMAQQQRHPSYPWPQGAGQGPPAKRPRHSGPSGAPGSSDGAVDTSIEDEENVSLGDYFDHLSPRDISMARYTQHHRWMEEIFSSPYASRQIVPPDLGLGLMGALKGLTDGILDPPSIEDTNSTAAKPPTAKGAAPFTNLKKEQLEEFNTRVQKHLDEGQAEIERMKKEHAEKMAEFKKGSVLMQAEKRLRNATCKGREQIDTTSRLDGVSEGDGPRETVEDIVKDVESKLGMRVTGYEDATLIEKGGLEEKEDRSRDEIFGNEQQQDAQMLEMQQQQQHATMGGFNGGVSAAPAESQKGPSAVSETRVEALQPKIPQDAPQSSYQGDQQSQQVPLQPVADEIQQQNQSDLDQDDMFGDGGGMDLGDTSLMEGMGMDVDVDNGGIDTSNIDFLDDPLAGMGEQPDLSAAGPGPGPSGAGEGAVAAATVAAAVGVMGSPQQQPPPPHATQPPASAANDPPVTMSTAGGDHTAAADGEDNLFHDPMMPSAHDGDFDDLATEDFGIDDSAFGDAMHGMETPGEDS